MSEAISQAEIDALLSGMATEGPDAAAPVDSPPAGVPPAQWAELESVLNQWQSLTWSAAGTAVSEPVQLSGLRLSITPATSALEQSGQDPVLARLPFSQGVSGEAYLILSNPLASALAAGLIGEPVSDLSGDAGGALAEVLGEVLNRGLSGLEAALGMVTLGGVELTGATADVAAALGQDSLVALAQCTVMRQGAPEPVGLVLPLAVAKAMAARLAPKEPPKPLPAPPRVGHAVDARPAVPLPKPPTVAPKSVKAQPARFEEFDAGLGSEEQSNIGLLMDVSLSVTVELGRTRKQIREVLALTPGSVLELEKLAGEPVDVLVNGKLIARGEVLVIGEQFGVRITEIVSPAERAVSIR